MENNFDAESSKTVKGEMFCVLLGILEQIDQICKRHHLTYFAAYGTMLGAVRHHGFIPWDDDIDLMMPRDDYNRFVEIAEKELGSPYFLETTLTEPGFAMSFARVRNSNTTATVEWDLHNRRRMNMGMWIAIFPMDICPKKSERPHIASYKVLAVNWIINGIIHTAYDRPDNSIKRLLKNFIARALIYCIGRRRLYSMRERNMASFRHLDGDWTIFTDLATYIGNHFDKEVFAQTEWVPFENTKMPVPIGYDKVLTSWYGDWRKPVKGAQTHWYVDLDLKTPYKKFVKAKYGYEP